MHRLAALSQGLASVKGSSVHARRYQGKGGAHTRQSFQTRMAPGAKVREVASRLSRIVITSLNRANIAVERDLGTNGWAWVGIYAVLSSISLALAVWMVGNLVEIFCRAFFL